MDARRLPLAGALAGALVGLAAVGGLVAAGVLERSDVVTGEAAAESLVEAWERSRGATYAMEGTFERQAPGAGVLESATFEAQRPPDRLRRGFGGIDGTLDGRSLVCTTGPAGDFRCAPTGPATDHAAEVAAEVARLEAYVSTDPPLYDVARDSAGCFLLQQRVPTADPPPYGRTAAMCFDDDTGALRYLRVEHPSGVVDTFEAREIRGVSDVDFSLEGDGRFASRVERPEPDEPADPDEPTAPSLVALDLAALFEACHADGGERDLHTELWDRATSINDPRWLEPDGSVGPCGVRGVAYYLERIATGG